MGTNCSSWHRATIPSVTCHLRRCRQQPTHLCHPGRAAVSPLAPLARARGFASVGLPSCSKGLNAFKAIKQGLSKVFNAFKCNLNAFKAKRAQVAVMLSKHSAPSAQLQGSFSGSRPISPVSPVAGLHCSPHPTGKLAMGPAAFSLQLAKRGWVPAAGGMLWQLSLGTMPGSHSAGGPLLAGRPVGPARPQGILPRAWDLRVSRP